MANNRTGAVHVTLEPQILSLIDEKCGGPKRNAGKLAGRSNYVRSLIYKDLGVKSKISDPHRLRHEQAYGDLLGIPCPPELSPEETRVFQLLQEGHGLLSIARILTEEGYVTKRNKKWRRETVRQLLQQLRNTLQLVEVPA